VNILIVEIFIIAPMLFSLQIPCVMFHYFPDTLENVKKICKALNIEIKIEQNQTCCGLPYFDKGEKQAAKTIAEYNLKIFSDQNLLCVSKDCEKTYTNYYPKIFNNTVSHNECMKMAAQVKGFDFIYDKLDKFDFYTLSGKYFYLPENANNGEEEIIKLDKFKNIEWFLPSLIPTSDGSSFSMPIFSPIESEKLALQIINEAVLNTPNIIVNNSISRQYLNTIAAKYKLEINIIHLIDLVAIAI